MFHDLQSFYRSREWETLRSNLRLERMNESGDIICAECGQIIIRPYDCIAHHIEELNEVNVHDRNISLNPDNILLLHARCHNKVHERWGYASRVKKVCIVWGSPCAGKSRFVQDSAGKQDLIIDMDRLYSALSTDEYRGAVKTNVLNTYRGLIDMVKTRNGRWKTAWIVRTLPLNIDRESIVREVNGGELIHIDTDKETCLIEAHQRGGEWVDWVEQYWERFQKPE